MPLYALNAASQADLEAGTSLSTVVTPARQQFHPSAAKAWAEFNSAGTLAASYNIASITDSGAGDFAAVIATDFSSGAWTALMFSGRATGPVPLICSAINTTAAGSLEIATYNVGGSKTDASSPDQYHFAAFGDQ
jgi:hypothetical protein